MTTNTTPESVLDGLLTCGECGELMGLNGSPEPTYAYRPGPGNGWSHCRTPRLRAGPVEDLFIGSVLRTVLTEQNTIKLLAAANDPQPGGGEQSHGLTRDDARELQGHTDLFVQAVGGATETRDFLCRFIAEIRVHPGKGAVHYSIPLPADSPLAGMREQEIGIPEGALA